MDQNTEFTKEPSVDFDISTLAQRFVLNLFNQKNDAGLVFHTYRQGYETVRVVNALAQANGSTKEEWEATVLAAWFYNVGYLLDYQNPAPKSIELAEKFFAAHHLDGERKAIILQTLRSVHSSGKINAPESQMLSDAIRAVQFGEGFFENAPLLQLEREMKMGEKYEKLPWLEYLHERLMRVRFFTAHGKVQFEPQVSAHLITLRQRIEKQKRREGPAIDTDKRFGNLAPRINSGAQTFFRTNYRNHIELSAIADGKANIMISVNAILISVIISIVSIRNMMETNPEVMMPVAIFLVTGLASLVFAVLSARPKVTSIINDSTPLNEAKRNLVFFGNFIHLKVDKYEEMVEEMFQDTELLYGNMTRDLYYLGKVLDKKYRFLSISYNIFMVGFVATVLFFLGVLLT